MDKPSGATAPGAIDAAVRQTLRRQTRSRILRMKELYLLFLIPLALLAIFKYVPMVGVMVAFKDYSARAGILGSPWNDFEHFKFFFSTPQFPELLLNTFRISLLKFVFGFPAPIAFALILNELTNRRYKRAVQSISYLPHFLSWVVLGAIFKVLFSVERGPINAVIQALGVEPIYFLAEPDWFLFSVVITHIWKSIGWGSIIFLASITSIDPGLYDAADVDGANRLQKVRHVTLPSMIPVITIMLILTVQNLNQAGFDQIYNLYNPLVFSVADIFETYVYRVGLVDRQYDFGAAVGLFQNLVAVMFVLIANTLARRYSDYALW